MNNQLLENDVWEQTGCISEEVSGNTTSRKTRHWARDENIRRINDLALRVAQGNQAAFNELATAKDAQIRKMACDLKRKYGNSFIDEDELYQIGLVTLWERAAKYEGSSQDKLSFWTETSSMINMAMRRYIRATCTAAYIPANAWNILDPLCSYLSLPEISCLSHQEQLAVLSEKLGLHEKQVEEYMMVRRRFLPIDETDMRQTKRRYRQTDPDLTAASAEEEMLSLKDNTSAQKAVREAMNAILATLTPREEDIVRRSVGLETGETETFTKIAKDYNLTTDRIRQIYEKAMRKLRQPTRSRSLIGLANDYGSIDLPVLRDTENNL